MRPYRPRYLLPDYAKALQHGSQFLELPAAQDFDDALAYLLIMYSQTPSITGYPVYFGDLDTLLLPYVDGGQRRGPATRGSSASGSRSTGSSPTRSRTRT